MIGIEITALSRFERYLSRCRVSTSMMIATDEIIKLGILLNGKVTNFLKVGGVLNTKKQFKKKEITIQII